MNNETCLAQFRNMKVRKRKEFLADMLFRTVDLANDISIFCRALVSLDTLLSRDGYRYVQDLVREVVSNYQRTRKPIIYVELYCIMHIVPYLRRWYELADNKLPGISSCLEISLNKSLDIAFYVISPEVHAKISDMSWCELVPNLWISNISHLVYPNFPLPIYATYDSFNLDPNNYPEPISNIIIMQHLMRDTFLRVMRKFRRYAPRLLKELIKRAPSINKYIIHIDKSQTIRIQELERVCRLVILPDNLHYFSDDVQVMIFDLLLSHMRALEELKARVEVLL